MRFFVGELQQANQVHMNKRFIIEAKHYKQIFIIKYKLGRGSVQHLDASDFIIAGSFLSTRNTYLCSQQETFTYIETTKF